MPMCIRSLAIPFLLLCACFEKEEAADPPDDPTTTEETLPPLVDPDWEGSWVMEAIDGVTEADLDLSIDLVLTPTTMTQDMYLYSCGQVL